MARTNRSGSPSQTAVGLGLIGVGLILRSRRSQRLYATTVDTGRTIAIRNASGTGV